MRQHARFKREHPGCVLLFRIGDFYELFDDDAVVVSKAIGLTLTQRTAGVPMCGMPYHQLDVYLRRLIAQGFRVAVCDQLQDASEAKGGQVIQRGVTRVLTPGTLVDEQLLNDDEASAVAAVCFPGATIAASNGAPGEALASVAIAELSTGTLVVLTCPAGGVGDELARRGVREVIYAETMNVASKASSARTGAGETGGPTSPPERLLSALGAAAHTAWISTTARPQWHFRLSEAREAIFAQFGVSTLAGFGLGDDDPEVQSAGALVRYLRETQSPGEGDASGAAGRATLAHLRPPRREQGGEHLVIDASSLRALEVDRTIRSTPTPSDAGDGSLLGIFAGRGGTGSTGGAARASSGGESSARARQGCRTPMGRRLLREWLCRPSCRREVIEARQRCVATLVEARRSADELASLLAQVQDVERIGARVALARCTPRDLVALGQSLDVVERLSAALEGTPAFAAAGAVLGELSGALRPVSGRIALVCVEQPPSHLREGGLIRPGIDAELDEARALRENAGQWLAEYQSRLVSEHNIPSLKVGYNKIFGYYIELSKGQSSRAPASFSRRQTLTGAERFITPELKAFEDKAQHAEAIALRREQELFASLCALAGGVLGPIARFGQVVAELDVLLCFADKASARGWVRPTIVDEAALSISQGRHPVLDERLGERFVPNDLELGRRVEAGSPNDNGTPSAEPGGSLALITGPNMAGKSTFIRQTALLVLLAHTGSFVPAERATIGLCDRIFTRVGADDALFAGQSTFMVEMTETANILHHATERSLVVLDEIGRGTSTLDGLSLAWAIAEALAQTSDERRGPRTLFATHYHELTRLEELMPGRVTNLHVAVREWEDQVVFLHRILPGRTDRSFGLHVAKMAGIPASALARAREVLDSLSVQHSGASPSAERVAPPSAERAPSRRADADGQLALFTEYLPHPVVDALRELKLESLSPMQAFDALRTLRERSLAKD